MRSAVPCAWAVLVALACSLVAQGQTSRITLDPETGWTAPVPVSEGAAAGLDRRLLDIARRLLADNEAERAQRLLNDWVRRNDRPGNALLAEALRLRGDAKLARGQEYNALFDYERVIREFPATPEFVTAIEREVSIAELYLNGLRQRLFGFRIEGSSGTAQEILLRAQERVPGSRLAERASIMLADYYYRTRRLDLAADMYKLFLENYPSSPFRKRAMRNRAYATIAGFKGPAYDGLSLLDAEILIENFIQQYPAEADRALLSDALLSRIDESAGAQQLVVAKWYITNDDAAAAAYTLRRLLRDYPGTVAAARGLQILQERGWLEAADRTDAGA